MCHVRDGLRIVVAWVDGRRREESGGKWWGSRCSGGLEET
jgi:hypothetical protein